MRIYRRKDKTEWFAIGLDRLNCDCHRWPWHWCWIPTLMLNTDNTVSVTWLGITFTWVDNYHMRTNESESNGVQSEK